MAQPEHYDTISVGGGESGNFICWTRAATLGVKTAVIEVKNIGGSCPNIACLPSKNFLFSAEVAHLAEKYTKSGLLKGTYEGIDMSAVRKRKREMVDGLVETFLGVFKETGAELVQGYARLIAPNRVEVELNGGGKRVLSADNIIINTGSRAKIDSTLGLKEAKPLTHIELLELDVLPEHLIILGGGYVGMEFAQTFRRLGSQVSVIERNARIMKKEDEDVSSVLVQVLEREGVQFHTSTQVDRVQGESGQSVALNGTKNGKPFEIQGSHLLVASGRTPNTVGFGLQEAGVELTATGHVKVNEYLQTTVPSIFAAGVCAGSPDFTHVAFDDFRVVTEYLTKGHSRSTQNRQVPYTLYTNPELAHVGLNENSARQRGLKYRLAKLPMTWFLRTRTQDQTDGFAKILISSTDDKILGFTALGARAGELLPVIQLAMSAGLPYTSIETLVIAHPTLNENLLTLLAEVPSKD